MNVEKSSYHRMLKEVANQQNKSFMAESQNSEGINTLEDSWKTSSPDFVKHVSDHEDSKQAPDPSISQNLMSTSQKLPSNSLAQLSMSNQYKQGDADVVVNKIEEFQVKPQKSEDEGSLNGFELQFSCADDCLVIEALKKDPLCHYEKKINKELMKELFGEKVLEIFETPENLKNLFEQAEGSSLRISMNNEAQIKLIFDESFIPVGREIFIQLENKAVGLDVSNLYLNRIQSLSKKILLPENMNAQRLGEINGLIQKQCQTLQGIIDSLKG